MPAVALLVVAVTPLIPLPTPKLPPGAILNPVGAVVLQKGLGKLAITKLAPAKLFPNLCVYRYPVSTPSDLCRQYVDQGLGYHYSYVWMEAARSYETALQHDPECAFAWYGLAKACEKWGRGDATKALSKAKELLHLASDREQMLIKARLHEKGMMEGTAPDERKKKAAATLDELLTLYPEDEEAWFMRAQIAEGNAAVPFYHALLRLNPIHPGASHELVHFYENFRRPALGWKWAEAYMKSSPGIPHAFHMQAHLATRLGKWDKTSDHSAHAIVLQRAYHREQGVKPSEDHQYTHHMDILSLSLIHDGRFAEARALQAECRADNVTLHQPWFRLHVAERDFTEAAKIVDAMRKKDRNKTQSAYFAAILALEQGDLAKADAEIHVLREAVQKNKSDRRNELRLWEVQGRYLCLTGQEDAGLKLLEKAVERMKNDYTHHAWGNGAYYMELWGLSALAAGREKIAEEAFLEALAHDAGSVRGALGMWALCERLGRTREAERYLGLAQRFWSRAASKDFTELRDRIARAAEQIPARTAVGSRSITEVNTEGASRPR